MHYLIDGYNVIFRGVAASKKLTGEQLQGERSRLIQALSRFRRRGRDHVTVVFDGGIKGKVRHTEGAAPGVEVVFSGTEASADDVIIEKLERRHRSKRIIAVSDDRSIRDAARRTRVQSMRVADFLSRIQEQARADREAEPAVKYHGISREEVPWWKRYFNVEEDEAE